MYVNDLTIVICVYLYEGVSRIPGRKKKETEKEKKIHLTYLTVEYIKVYTVSVYSVISAYSTCTILVMYRYSCSIEPKK